MKKILLILALAICQVASAAVGDTFRDAFWGYRVNGDQTVSIDDLVKELPTGDVVLPSTVENDGETYTVTEIGNLSLGTLTSLTIPASIEKVDMLSAEGSKLLISAGVNPVTFKAHWYGQTTNFKFEEVNLDRSIFLELDAGGENRADCIYFRTNVMTLGANIKEIGKGVFKDVYPYADNQKVRYNIADWQAWTKVKMADSTSCPYAATAGHNEIYVGGMKMTSFPLDGLTEISEVFVGLPFEGDLIMPEGIKRIADNVFSENQNLYMVRFNSDLEVIGNKAFYNCKNLEFNSFPESLRSIGLGAFSGCDKIKSIVIPESVTDLGKIDDWSYDGTFSNMAGLEKVIMNCKITELPHDLFAGCTTLSSVTLPKGLISIGYRAFSRTSLKDIDLPNSLQSIGDFAFSVMRYGAPEEENLGLESLKLPTSVKTIGKSAFAGCHIRSLVGNEGLESIGEDAFGDNPYLAVISLPSTLTDIGNAAFYSASCYDEDFNSIVVPTIVVPKGVKTIGENTFNRIIGKITVLGAETIESGSLGTPYIVELGENVKTIAPDAFKFDNLALISINSKAIPSVSGQFGVTSEQLDNITVEVPDGTKDDYGTNFRWRVFKENLVEKSKADVYIYCDGTYPISEEIRTQSGIMPSRVCKHTVTGSLTDNDFRLIRENMLSLYSLNLNGISNTTLPDGVLQGNSALNNLVLPSKLTAIPDNAFNGCLLMEIQSIPTTVTSIGNNAFRGCLRFSLSELPEGVTTIGGEAFSGCNSIKELTLPASLKTIGNGTFSNCQNLDFVDFSSTEVKTIPRECFSGTKSLSQVALPEGLTSIGGFAFYNTRLESIVIPESVNSIGESAFYGTKLRSIEIPEGVSTINSGTLADCPRLVSTSFPQSLRTISEGVFTGSTKVISLSSRAVDAPSAATGTFSGMRVKRVSLTVPRQSYRSYLNAPQWGMFSELFNRLEVTIPEDVEVSSLPEEEYQEILEEEKLEEEQEIENPEEEDPEVDPENPEVDPEDPEVDPENPNEPQSVRAKMRRAAKQSLKNGTAYARVFNDATLAMPDDSKGLRIFLNPKPGAEITSVLLNGTDISDQVVDNMLLLTSLNGNLEITTKKDLTAVESVEAEEAVTGVYDINGTYCGTTTEGLLPGLYIVRTATTATKVLVK